VAPEECLVFEDALTGVSGRGGGQRAGGQEQGQSFVLESIFSRLPIYYLLSSTHLLLSLSSTSVISQFFLAMYFLHFIRCCRERLPVCLW